MKKPPKIPPTKRTAVVHVRLAPEELALVKRAAALSAQAVTDYIRGRILHAA